MVSIAASFTDFRNLNSITNFEDFQNQVIAKIPNSSSVSLEQIRLGNEFCERLMPSRKQVEKSIFLAEKFKMTFALVLANLTDEGHKKLHRIMPALEPKNEIVVNDWGTAYLLSESYPEYTLIAGRLLCKHLKEARIATPEEFREVKWPVDNPHFKNVLSDLGINKAEVDLAPHTVVPGNKVEDVLLTLHLNRGYSAKSHVCKIGSAHQPKQKKFSSGHRCRRECLRFRTTISKLPHPRESTLEIYQRGNTWFYGYSDQMNISISQSLQNSIFQHAVVTLD